MNFHMNVTKINIDKIITFGVVAVIIIYLIIGIIREFDFSNIKNIFSDLNNQISMDEIYDYLDRHSNYYYKIEGSTYCINKDELINSSEISDKFISNMQANIIEAIYEDNMFVLKYNDDCIQR